MINNLNSYEREILVQRSFDEIMQLRISSQKTANYDSDTRMVVSFVAGSLFLLHIGLELGCLVGKFACIAIMKASTG
jgi:hypothetical protein